MRSRIFSGLMALGLVGSACLVEIVPPRPGDSTGGSGGTPAVGAGGTTSQGGAGGDGAQVPTGPLQPTLARAINGGPDDEAYDVIALSSGHIAVAGQFQSTVDFGGGVTLNGAGSRSGLVVVLDDALQHVSSTAVVSGTQVTLRSIAETTAGALVLGGQFQGDITEPGISLSTSGRDRELTLQLDANLTPSWGHSFGLMAETYKKQIVNGVVARSDQGAVVVGVFKEGFDFPASATLSGTAQSMSEFHDGDSFAFSFQADGKLVWFHRIQGTNPQNVRAVAISANDDLFLVGRTENNLHVNSDTIGAVGDEDAFIYALRGSGAAVWGDVIGASGASSNGRAVAVDDSHVFVVGDTTGAIDFGGAGSSAGSVDAFVAIYDHDGNRLGGFQFGGMGTDLARSAAVDAAGRLLLVGSTTATMTVAGETVDVPSSPLGAGYLLVLDISSPSAPLLVQSLVFGPDGTNPQRVVTRPDGSVAVVGSFQGGMSWGPTSLQAVESRDIFVGILEPQP